METAIVAMAPPVPLAVKLMISLLMVALPTFLIVSGRIRQWNRAPTLAAAIISVITVITLELAFPHHWSPGLDGHGVLAALVGIVAAGVSAPWLIRRAR